MTLEEARRRIEHAAAQGWTELDLAGLGLTQLPEEIGKCTQLESLVLGKWEKEKKSKDGIKGYEFEDNRLVPIVSGNKLKDLPAELAHLVNLRKLDLSGNSWEKLPDVVLQLGQLEQLTLIRAELQEIPEAIGQLSQLTQLDLSRNQIAEIPQAIGQLSQLTQLSLWDNQITQIPEAIGQLSQLTQLGLSDNQIAQIPEAIGQLSQLTLLHLSDNQIAEIPEAIGQLSQLTQLDLSGNQITEIPEAIRRLEKLEKLDLRRNPIPIPPEILGEKELWRTPGDVHTILDFYFQTRDPNATEPLYEAKLLIIGEGEAGKTSLAQKLLNPDYELKPQEPTTEGIDVLRWEFPHANSKFRVHLWDFGGQAIYHATHQFFLTERSLYILLVDNRRENPNLCYWLSIVELLSQKSPILLVQNEKEDRRCEINVSQLRGDFDNLEKHYPINLATDRGLEDLQRAICQRIAILDHVGTPIPKRWANVRHILENYSQRKTHIEFTEFCDICVSQGFNKSDKRAIVSLSKYLHDLGIILHFQKNPDGKKSILYDWVILRPEWATNAVYKVTDNPEVKANGGYFTQDNLCEIWSDDEYDGLHDELLELMQNFKLCYPIPNQAGHYIAPNRLPVEPPTYTWDDTDNLIVRYEYEFMPKGIITRLIVEMHPWICRVDPPQPPLKRGENSGIPLIKGDGRGISEDLGGSPDVATRSDLVWRDGVLLTDGYANAEVIENYHQREIRIRVSGTQKKTLLDSIRHELWKIHRSYDNRLKFQEFIPCNCPQCKGNPDPHLYAFDNLRRRLNNHRYEVECEKHYVMVNVRGLMNDFPDYSQQWERPYSGIDRSDIVDPSKDPSSPPQIVINNIIGDKNMTQEASKTNNFNGTMSGVIGSDNAQVSNNTFTQTNNANTAELLQLVASLRQTVTQFPEDIREDIIIDLDHVEAEIQKPESDRNPTKLKKRLMAMLAAATAVALPVAGITDFTNNITSLAEKAGIELSLSR